MPLKRKKRGRPPKDKVMIKMEPDVSYACEICSRSFYSNLALSRHRKYCGKQTANEINDGIPLPKTNYTCKKCNKKFRFKLSYSRHLENDHATGPNSVPCTQCSVRCPDSKTLDMHISNIHERKIFECEYCGKKFVRKSHVLRHMSQMGCDGREATKYPCEICDATFNRKDNLMVHLRIQHIVRNPFVCKHCTYHTRSFSKLIIHFQRNHSDTPLQFICDYCGQVTKSRTAMAKHLEIHGEKKYECSVCGYNTYTVEVMRRHVLTHVQDKPHKCEQCGKSYIQRSQLQRHMRRHHENACPECGTSFVTKAKMIFHSRVHLGTERFVCPIEDCPQYKQEFNSEAVLRNHISKTHLGEKTYTCEVCSKVFNNEMNMRRHMNIHTLERPRRCMYCVSARAYVRGMQLVRHVRKVHFDVFRDHLVHVRSVLGSNIGPGRVKKSEMEAILTLLDAESERILEGYGSGVLYGGIQEDKPDETSELVVLKSAESPLMNEETLAYSLNKLLEQLIDKETLQCFGWPEETVDNVLEKVIENCGARAAARDKWTRVQRLRENAKHLFLYVVEDKNVARMLHTHTIDQIIKHILAQGNQDDEEL